MLTRQLMVTRQLMMVTLYQRQQLMVARGWAARPRETGRSRSPPCPSGPASKRRGSRRTPLRVYIHVYLYIYIYIYTHINVLVYII